MVRHTSCHCGKCLKAYCRFRMLVLNTSTCELNRQARMLVDEEVLSSLVYTGPVYSDTT